MQLRQPDEHVWLAVQIRILATLRSTLQVCQPFQMPSHHQPPPLLTWLFKPICMLLASMHKAAVCHSIKQHSLPGPGLLGHDVT